MISINTWCFAGYLTADPEPHRTRKGDIWLSFRMCLNVWDGREDKEKPVFVDCRLFGPRAPKVEPYLHKGDWCIIHGPLKVENYTSKTGEVKKALLVNVQQLDFRAKQWGDPRNARPQNAEPARATPYEPPEEEEPFPPERDPVDDVPF